MRIVSARTLRATALALSAIIAFPALPGAPAQAQARSAPDSFADLAARLLPGVVNISSSQLVTARGDNRGPDVPVFPPGSPFEQFFKYFMDRNRPVQRSDLNAPTPAPAPRRAQSLGSGFIIDASGIVVTNNH